MQRFMHYIGIKAAICFGIIQLFLILGVSAGFSEEQCNPPVPELQVRPFCKFGTGAADASLAAVNPPDGLAFTGDGLLLATDALNHRVQIFDPYSGKHMGSIGDPSIFTGEVVDIAVLPDKGLLISDEKANQIYRFKRTTATPVTFQPISPPLLSGEGFKRLCGLACDSKGRIYVVDGIAGEVRRYFPDFKPDLSWKFQSTRPDNGLFLNKTEGVAIDESRGTLFLSSDWDGMVQVFDLETGKWTGKSIGRGTEALTGKPLGQSVFSVSVEGLAIIDDYLLVVDEGEVSASKNYPGHILIFDLRSPVLYETDAEKCRKRMADGIKDGLVGWFGSYVSPDSVAVFPGSVEHPEPLVAIANQGSYEVLVYKWEDIKNEIAKAHKEERIP
ncbi:MAG: NHL repeat-containing protein [Candidatus Omnitrophica bacterium]|nr:NHL repeat-containing protein [Candidatus Omnitrophota bacterium]